MARPTAIRNASPTLESAISAVVPAETRWTRRASLSRTSARGSMSASAALPDGSEEISRYVSTETAGFLERVEALAGEASRRS